MFLKLASYKLGKIAFFAKKINFEFDIGRMLFGQLKVWGDVIWGG